MSLLLVKKKSKRAYKILFANSSNSSIIYWEIVKTKVK